MNQHDVFALTSELITYQAVTGAEKSVLDYLCKWFQQQDWSFEKIPVKDDSRYCILVKFGQPRIVFTTHVDVVPAKPEQFQPIVKEQDGDLALFGRGACDAQGILCTMIAACKQLEVEANKDFALLVVFEEEAGGLGAQSAAVALQNQGIEYIVNGEPTQNKLAVGHKGVVRFSVVAKGKNAHSGYPELGDDANRKLIEAASQLYKLDCGKHPILGVGTINIGEITGGTAHNIISDYAKMEVMLRNVIDAEEMKERVIAALDSDSESNLELDESNLELDFLILEDPVELEALADLPSTVVSYYTDIPSFKVLNAKAVLYGPGDIARAHTDEEYILASEVKQAIVDYQKIFKALKKKLQ